MPAPWTRVTKDNTRISFGVKANGSKARTLGVRTVQGWASAALLPTDLPAQEPETLFWESPRTTLQIGPWKHPPSTRPCH